MMMRLNEPQYSFDQTIDECILGVTGNRLLATKLNENKLDLTNEGLVYSRAASTGELYTIPTIHAVVGPDPYVINNLRKSELVKVYDQYFISQKKPARQIYDALLNAARERCPFCGGIGTPRNLDHFLPKSHYPQFSVLPLNLIPACRDCNMDGKAQAFATNAEEQVIQPYTDNDRFFMEQWIFAKYHAAEDGEPGEFEYYISPPDDWDEVDQKRVGKHFDDFDLAKRYATKAAERLVTVLNQIKHMEQNGVTLDVILKAFLRPGVDFAPFPNHWERGMFQALIKHFAVDW